MGPNVKKDINEQDKANATVCNSKQKTKTTTVYMLGNAKDVSDDIDSSALHLTCGFIVMMRQVLIHLNESKVRGESIYISVVSVIVGHGRRIRL